MIEKEYSIDGISYIIKLIDDRYYINDYTELLTSKTVDDLRHFYPSDIYRTIYYNPTINTINDCCIFYHAVKTRKPFRNVEPNIHEYVL